MSLTRRTVDVAFVPDTGMPDFVRLLDGAGDGIAGQASLVKPGYAARCLNDGSKLSGIERAIA